ncbi:NAD(P)/FAD-dependent oxidoreductase [Halococcus sp. IIIV-5B]|uniref:NAD(P)/FAD-dependent oxidoreductase n=1 Tax=Halococcus sp. IIIV-5B TaxID=2321230 RepID=UPI000E740AE1|nr:FAD-dependent oxidoreductase [Halococcus sp. IIIV-5B]RJT06773.1 NADH dehydrogenase FAD-containing subunit [Halococcus sp. IIIV-5B]
MNVAVLGAGYAGLMLARRLERSLPSSADIVVVNDRPDHLVQHELHRVVRRPALADRITVDLDDVLDRAEVRVARVTDVDHEAGVAHLDDETGESALDYDVGAVCLGAETAYYDLPGIEEHSIPLKRLPDAARIRKEFLDLGSRDRAVVGGAGLSGVQVAGELAALADEEALGCEVTLLEQADAVAPNFDADFQTAVRDELESCGVVVKTGRTVERATDTAVEFEDREALDYDQLVWTGGLRGPDALGGERPLIPDTLKLGDGTFVVGDAARVTDTDGAAVPASAAAAVREALTVAKSITRIVEDDRDGVFEPRPERFRFDAPGWLVSVGDGAVGQVGPRVVRGAAANTLKSTVGATYLSVVGAPSNAVGLVRDEP